MPTNPVAFSERLPVAQRRPPDSVSHRVQFYVSDEFLARHVAEFLRPGLSAGVRALVIATTKHRPLFEGQLGDEARALETTGQLTWIDAHQLLDRFLVDAWPDAGLFDAALAPLVDGVPGPMVAYGEMVDALFGEGNPEASIRLEELWNGFLASRNVSLLCAHSMRSFGDARQSALFRAVCDRHSHVAPAEIEMRSPDALAREIAALQQQGWALQAELRERVGLEVALGEAQRAVLETHSRRDRFLATLAHELRNPLAPMQNAVQILRATAPAGADLPIEVIDRQVRQMTRLIDDLLDLSRVTTGRIDLHLERVGIRDILQAALEMSRPVIDRAGLELVIAMPPAGLDVEGDLTRLAQVLANVLDNAAKFTDRGGRITLRTERVGNEAVISVNDTGVGIRPDMLDRMFEMFTHGQDGRGRVPGGLGIGLTVARQLVELHGGRISATSGGLGAGSTFRIALPLAPKTAVRPDPDGGSPRQDSPSGLRVLVVDDNIDSASTMAMFLEICGHTVRMANDGVEAVAAAGEFRPNAVLMDIGLPGMDGREAGRAIRAEAWGGDIVLIALSGWGQDSDKQRSRDAGFDHHLVKPVDHAVLSKILAQTAVSERLTE
jgi:signal transduction histidine kinase/ActR/RegA family two-component response regulator